MHKILLVEDNPKIQHANANMLMAGGYDVCLANSITQARKTLASQSPDMIILDIMLPDGSGLDFLKELRAQGNDIPVLLLTALSEVSDQIAGILAGGDDYLSKPYDIGLLLVRIELMLRRAGSMPEVIKRGALEIRVTSDEAFVNNVNLKLPQKEFSLLCYFEQNENKTMTGEHLYEKIWGQQMGKDTGALRQAISRLRSKLKGSGYSINSKRNEGYRFEKGEQE